MSVHRQSQSGPRQCGAGQERPGLWEGAQGPGWGSQSPAQHQPSGYPGQKEGEEPTVDLAERSKIQFHSQAWFEVSKEVWEEEHSPPSPSRAGARGRRNCCVMIPNISESADTVALSNFLSLNDPKCCPACCEAAWLLSSPFYRPEN